MTVKFNWGELKNCNVDLYIKEMNKFIDGINVAIKDNIDNHRTAFSGISQKDINDYNELIHCEWIVSVPNNNVCISLFSDKKEAVDYAFSALSFNNLVRVYNHVGVLYHEYHKPYQGVTINLDAHNLVDVMENIRIDYNIHATMWKFICEAWLKQDQAERDSYEG